MANMKKPLVVNFFAGPGAGKSTLSAAVFAELKFLGIDCELVREYAKDKVWEESYKTLDDQIYVFGKQLHRLNVLSGKVQVVITDSPIVLSMYYDKSMSQELRTLVLKEFHKFDNINYFINRKKAYNPNGRMQTEDEAKVIDNVLCNMLAYNGIDFSCIDGTRGIVGVIVGDILRRLEADQ